MINGVDIYDSFSDKDLKTNSLETNEIVNNGKLTTSTIETNFLTATYGTFNSSVTITDFLKCDVYYLRDYTVNMAKCRIVIRDQPNLNKILYTINGLGFNWYNKIKFMYMQFLTSSSYTTYTKPSVNYNGVTGSNLCIGIDTKNNSSIVSGTQLSYIVGIMYDESTTNTIYQYNTESKYDSSILYRSTSGAPFNKANVCVEFISAEIAE